MTDRPSPQILHLQDLREPKPDRPGWSFTFGAACADAAAVCVDSQNHTQPILFQIDGIQTTDILIHWNVIDDTIRRFNADLEVATEPPPAPIVQSASASIWAISLIRASSILDTIESL